MEKIRTIRGIRDIIYPESEKLGRIAGNASGILESYGYRRIYLPALEYTRLFSRSIGEDTDIVSKEMYAFEDKKGRRIALRPEGTAGVVRAMIENKLLRGRTREKVYYSGPMFRYERPQKGRYRQFYQIGCEVFGLEGPNIDAEIACIASEIAKGCAVGEFVFSINSVGCAGCRSSYREELKKFLQEKSDSLCGDCRRRINTNTLRVLDCKNRKCRSMFEEIPPLGEYICSKCRDSYESYKDLLEEMGVVFEEDDRLVRGLDYYTGSVFELKANDSVIAAGGRYNNLVRQLGGPEVPACGWAFGLERLANKARIKKVNIPQVYLACLKGADLKKCRMSAAALRKAGISVEEDYEDYPAGKKLKAADKKDAGWVLIMGENEANAGVITVKKMKTGEQEEVPENEIEKIIEEIKKTEEKNA